MILISIEHYSPKRAIGLVLVLVSRSVVINHLLSTKQAQTFYLNLCIRIRKTRIGKTTLATYREAEFDLELKDERNEREYCVVGCGWLIRSMKFEK